MDRHALVPHARDDRPECEISGPADVFRSAQARGPTSDYLETALLVALRGCGGIRAVPRRATQKAQPSPFLPATGKKSPVCGWGCMDPLSARKRAAYTDKPG